MISTNLVGLKSRSLFQMSNNHMINFTSYILDLRNIQNGN